MAANAAVFAIVTAPISYSTVNTKLLIHHPSTPSATTDAIKRSCFQSSISLTRRSCFVSACLPSSSSSSYSASRRKTRLFVSGLSFRTTEESLRKAFQGFGQLVEVNLVMDKIANRPRGFAFLNYATEEESQKAIEGMHGKAQTLSFQFLDGRVIFVEIAKPRSELRQAHKQNQRQN